MEYKITRKTSSTKVTRKYRVIQKTAQPVHSYFEFNASQLITTKSLEKYRSEFSDFIYYRESFDNVVIFTHRNQEVGSKKRSGLSVL